MAVSLVIIVAIIPAFGKFYGSFFREHKTVRFYANPSYYLYSAVEYLSDIFHRPNGAVAAIGTDARIPPTDQDRELIIVVVGEAARADRFSLNGYARETNPLLKQEDVISFTNVHSCGTSTAVSVPCMFSVFGHGRFTSNNAISSENLLDVLTHAGVHVLWRDNNSDSKGVAVRVPYQNFKQDNTNTICDVECRDEGMLVGLQDYVNSEPGGDIVIVLHQMGNHGPAYYKRYPKAFEKFTPVCASVELEQCSLEEISNAYDNAILYTDYFLSKVIAFLKHNDDHFETAMVYVSDHGESLGENGLYLHGLPYALAPEAQTHVPAILWFGRNYHVDRAELRQHVSHPYTHDNIFHTVLGLMEIQSSVYKRDLDLVHHRD
jgi:lipid A ethanolaminephosphotransferase